MINGKSLVTPLVKPHAFVVVAAFCCGHHVTHANRVFASFVWDGLSAQVLSMKFVEQTAMSAAYLVRYNARKSLGQPQEVSKDRVRGREKMDR